VSAGRRAKAPPAASIPASAENSERDPWVARLARLFATHPAWCDAARYASEGATSRVGFTHLPGERFRLVRAGSRTRLLAGDAADPDFAFRFTPGAIERLEAVDGGVGDFAVALFALMLEEDPELRVDLRIAAPFARLVSRGYLRLLLAAGARVLAFGAQRGVRTLGELRRLVEQLRGRSPEAWEREG